jgi:dihydroflavonol-4-reductase
VTDASTSDPGSATVLVTGGTGFLASWTIAELLNRGHAVRTTVRSLGRELDLRRALDTVTGPDAGTRLSVVEADLEADSGWDEAIASADYVLHIASPFPAAQPKDPAELIRPAAQGTLRVLRSAFATDVRRVVVTSSSSGVRGASGRPAGRPLTEEDWADPEDPRLTPYVRSKTLAEQAAWQFAQQQDATDRLTVICPTAILGPILGQHRSYSLQVIQRMLDGMPGLPRLGFGLVDVRDVAALHISAMTAPAAAGQRILGAGPFLWFAEVAAILRALGPEAAKVPKRTLPDAMVRLVALFDPGARSVLGELGQRVDYSADKALRLLDWKPRPTEDTIYDTARSLLTADAAAA